MPRTGPRPKRCPKCHNILPLPAKRTDGLPGVKYRSCNNCGYSQAVTAPRRRERLEETK